MSILPLVSLIGQQMASEVFFIGLRLRSRNIIAYAQPALNHDSVWHQYQCFIGFTAFASTICFTFVLLSVFYQFYNICPCNVLHFGSIISLKDKGVE